MMMTCSWCNRDINELGQDNCSPFCGFPLCEDCAKDKEVIKEIRKESEDEKWNK